MAISDGLPQATVKLSHFLKLHFHKSTISIVGLPESQWHPTVNFSKSFFFMSESFSPFHWVASFISIVFLCLYSHIFCCHVFPRLLKKHFCSFAKSHQSFPPLYVFILFSASLSSASVGVCRVVPHTSRGKRCRLIVNEKLNSVSPTFLQLLLAARRRRG